MGAKATKSQLCSLLNDHQMRVEKTFVRKHDDQDHAIIFIEHFTIVLICLRDKTRCSISCRKNPV